MKRLLAILLPLLLVAACAEHKVILPDKEYLKLGNQHLKEEEYAEARQAFEDLEANYPDSPLVVQARLGQAKAYFAQKRYGEAALEYKRFLRFHPRNPLADEAQYKLALSYFKQRYSIDRDTAHTRRALEEFNKLISQYPDSPLLTQALEKRDVCFEELAEHEFYVGHFYFKQEHYEAAIGRLRPLILDYPRTKAAAKALFFLAESYWQLGERAEAGRLFKLFLQRHGRHEYSAEARQRLQESAG